MEKYIREPVNSITHLFGAVVSAIGLILLINKGIKQNNVQTVTHETTKI